MNFDEAEGRFAILKNQRDSGQMSPAEFSVSVNDIRVEDIGGVWWQISEQDGKWLRWNGSAWVPGDPVRIVASSALTSKPAGIPAAPVKFSQPVTTRLCESCGAEINPEKKFCGKCGAPLGKSGVLPQSSMPNLDAIPHQPPPPPMSSPYYEPALSSLPPMKPTQSRDKLIIAGVLVAAIIAVIIFVVIPLLQPHDTTSGSLTGYIQPTSVQSVPGPYRTTVPPVTSLPSVMATASSGALVYRSGEAYEQVFSRSYNLGTIQDVFIYNLQQPPMIVECEMNPKMVTRQQLVDIGKSTERYITSTYADPAAWLDLKVINVNNNKIINTISFSKNYVGMMKQEYIIYAPGNYRFEMTGTLVSPNVRLLVKK
jgi:hypothetical protein